AQLGQEGARGLQVVQVDERQVASVELLHVREEVAGRVRAAVVGGALVRVLAVREVELLDERRDELLGERVAAAEPARNCGVVGGVCAKTLAAIRRRVSSVISPRSRISSRTVS